MVPTGAVLSVYVPKLPSIISQKFVDISGFSTGAVVPALQGPAQSVTVTVKTEDEFTHGKIAVVVVYVNV